MEVESDIGRNIFSDQEPLQSGVCTVNVSSSAPVQLELQPHPARYSGSST